GALSRAAVPLRRSGGPTRVCLVDFFARLDVGDAVAERLIDLPGRLPAMRDCVAMMELPDAVPEGQWEHPAPASSETGARRTSLSTVTMGRCRWTHVWRRECNSNRRYVCPYTRLPSVRLQPLGYPSDSRDEAAGALIAESRARRQRRRIRALVSCDPEAD